MLEAIGPAGLWGLCSRFAEAERGALVTCTAGVIDIRNRHSRGTLVRRWTGDRMSALRNSPTPARSSSLWGGDELRRRGRRTGRGSQAQPVHRGVPRALDVFTREIDPSKAVTAKLCAHQVRPLCRPALFWPALG